MARKEANFDLYIRDLMRDANIEPVAQGSDIVEIDEALKTASKRGTKKAGYPEFTAVVGDFVLVVEDKADAARLIRLDDGKISTRRDAVADYAVNGALHYARHIVEKTTFKKVFAFGNAGNDKSRVIRPLFVDENGDYRLLEETKTFENFSPTNIDAYYRRVVLNEEVPEEIDLKDALEKAKTLHEHLRNYGGLRDTEKPLVVSAILLALREREHGFSLDLLQGDDLESNTDGAILYKYLESNMARARVAPEVKKRQVLNQFTLIKDRPALNAVNKTLGKTPLKFFAEYIDRNIFRAFAANSSEDYLGRFYGEFVSYSGGDGQSLGVVLTPKHIAELFCELVDLRPSDVVLDPCAGTGGFLIAAMSKMLSEATNENEKKKIKSKRIHGVEIREDMFSLATTNMILRGDGQSNLICGDFFALNESDAQLKGGGVTVGFMNPPYSQAKNRASAQLSELSFARRLLNSVVPGGRVAVIVPVSAMIGKTNDDKAIKREILRDHTLEGVISLNKDTFYGVSTVPCIAVFTAGEPHPDDKLAKFINFEDDGYEVKKHLGLVETERAKDRRRWLLDCWRDKIEDVSSKFMVRTTVEPDDEWLHSFYYYNDEIPAEEDFLNSVADYLTFEFNMIAHGRGDLFAAEENAIRKERNRDGDASKLTALNRKEWRTFVVGDLFFVKRPKSRSEKKYRDGAVPFVASGNYNNGVVRCCAPVEGETLDKGNCITVSPVDGSAFYQEIPFLGRGGAGSSILILYTDRLNKYLGLYISCVITKACSKYCYGNMGTEKSIKRQKITLPVDENGAPDWAYMEVYTRKLFERVCLDFGRRKGLIV